MLLRISGRVNAATIRRAALAIAGSLALLTGCSGSGDDARPSPHDALPTQVPSLSPIATPIVPPPSLPDCASTDVALTLQAVGRGDNVLLRLSASGTVPCQMRGPMVFGLLHAPVDPAPGYPTEANISRNLQVALVFPQTAIIGEWKWENWCAKPMSWVFWQAKLNAPSSIQVALSNDVYPSCLRPDEPTTLARGSTVVGLEDDSTPDASCLRAGFPGWLCEFGTSVATDSAAGHQRLVPYRMTNDAWFRCDGAGGAPGLGTSDICLGEEANASVAGYWLSTPKGPGAFVSRPTFEGALKAALPSEAAFAAVACADGDGSCKRFAIAIGAPGSPAAVVLIFRLEAGREPAIVGAALGTLASFQSPLGDYKFTNIP